MNVSMPRTVVMQVLVHRFAVNMHVLMHQVRVHEKLLVGEDIPWLVIQLDPVVLAHLNGPLAYHFHDL